MVDVTIGSARQKCQRVRVADAYLGTWDFGNSSLYIW